MAFLLACHASAQLQPSGPLGGSGPGAPYDPFTKRTQSTPSRNPQAAPSAPSPSEAEAKAFSDKLVARCVAAEDASDVTSNLSKYVGKTFDVCGFIASTAAGPFTLTGGKGDLVGQPSANGSLACYASDAEVSRKLTHAVGVYEGFNMTSYAVLTVTVVQRETFPKYVTVIQGGSLLPPLVLGSLRRQLSLRMKNVR